MEDGPPGPSTDGPASSWKSFVDSVMKKRPLLGALLCHANFKLDPSEKGRSVILAFPEGSFYERQANDNKNRQEIEEALKNFFGRETTVAFSAGAANTNKSIYLNVCVRVSNILVTG